MKQGLLSYFESGRKDTLVTRSVCVCVWVGGGGGGGAADDTFFSVALYNFEKVFLKFLLGRGGKFVIVIPKTV